MFFKKFSLISLHNEFEGHRNEPILKMKQNVASLVKKIESIVF